MVKQNFNMVINKLLTTKNSFFYSTKHRKEKAGYDDF